MMHALSQTDSDKHRQTEEFRRALARNCDDLFECASTLSKNWDASSSTAHSLPLDIGGEIGPPAWEC